MGLSVGMADGESRRSILTTVSSDDPNGYSVFNALGTIAGSCIGVTVREMLDIESTMFEGFSVTETEGFVFKRFSVDKVDGFFDGASKIVAMAGSVDGKSMRILTIDESENSIEETEMEGLKVLSDIGTTDGKSV